MKDEFSIRLEKLESHIAHLERTVEQLNEVAIEQGKVLERLKKENLDFMVVTLRNHAAVRNPHEYGLAIPDIPNVHLFD